MDIRISCAGVTFQFFSWKVTPISRNFCYFAAFSGPRVYFQRIIVTIYTHFSVLGVDSMDYFRNLHPSPVKASISGLKKKKWCIFQTFHSKSTPFHRSIVHGCGHMPAALSFFILPQPPYFAAASAPRAYSSSSSLSMSSLGKSIAPFSTLQPSIW